MSADLKPCPFCGSPAELLHTKTWDYFVRCTDKGCAARTRQYHENDVGAVDAWNTRAERTCKYVVKDSMNETEGMGYVWFECSECHARFDYYSDEWLMGAKYCPNCGAKVVER